MADDRRVDIDIVAHDLASAVFKQVSANASSIFNSLTKVSKGIDRRIMRSVSIIRLWQTSIAH